MKGVCKGRSAGNVLTIRFMHFRLIRYKLIQVNTFIRCVFLRVGFFPSRLVEAVLALSKAREMVAGPLTIDADLIHGPHRI